MAMILDRTVDHSGPSPFFGDKDDDSYPITIPDGEQFDRVELAILEQTHGGANIKFTPVPGEIGSSRIDVHWWYNAGRTRGRIKYQVKAFSEALPAGLMTRFLDFRAAKEAGATFHHNIEQPTGPYTRLGVGDWLDHEWAGTWDDPKPGVVFQAVPAFPLVGVKANPDAYKDFRLKNGWTVRSISRQNWRSGTSVRFRFDQPPVIGSDNPFMQVHLEAGHAPNFIKVGIALLIVGPRGSDPYFD